MQLSYWERVVADGYRVPQGAALDELTLELVTMLGDPDARVRNDIGYSVLYTWINEGIYDHLLSGLGDGVAPLLRESIGEDGSDPAHLQVFRRSYAAAVLAAIVTRDNTTHNMHPAVVLTWADRAVAWFLSERDLRGHLPDYGHPHALKHGADLIAALSASRYLGVDELTVLLDVMAERLMVPTQYKFTDGDADRLAFATMSLLHRDLVSADTVEDWLQRLRGAWDHDHFSVGIREPWRTNTVAYLRSLHLQLVLGVRGTPTQFASSKAITNPSVRADVLIAIQQALRETENWYAR